MEELIELRRLVEKHDYRGALLLIDQLDEMSLADKLNKIDSFIVILLIHLIKQVAEGRTARSWDSSIRNSIREIDKVNRRKKTKGYYASRETLAEMIDQAYRYALADAAIEVDEGIHTEEELNEMVDAETVKKKALDLIDPV